MWIYLLVIERIEYLLHIAFFEYLNGFRFYMTFTFRNRICSLFILASVFCKKLYDVTNPSPMTYFILKGVPSLPCEIGYGCFC